MSRISGLNDLNEKKDDESKRNEYYAGGVDNRGGGSGLLVEGPPIGRRPPGDASSGDPFDAIVRLAENAERPASEAPPPGANSITIALYRNGFVVNDGPLRDLTSPESKAFLAAIEKGELPPELRSTATPDVVDVQLMDKRQQDYTPPPAPAYVAYSGEGARIGASSASDAFVFSAVILAGVPPITSDESKPTTTVQVKTHDGKKLRLKLNHDNTILQLAAQIHRSGGSAAGQFTLNSGFPPRDIIDPMQSISDANLIGASIVQKSA